MCFGWLIVSLLVCLVGLLLLCFFDLFVVWMVCLLVCLLVGWLSKDWESCVVVLQNRFGRRTLALV